VVVVEAAPRSGSLSGANHAMEQNRELFAVPGPVDSLASGDCQRLIRHGARLVETVDDILEELGPLVTEVHTSDSLLPIGRVRDQSDAEEERADPQCSSRRCRRSVTLSPAPGRSRVAAGTIHGEHSRNWRL
jgi:DNA processing protein